MKIRMKMMAGLVDLNLNLNQKLGGLVADNLGGLVEEDKLSGQ